MIKEALELLLEVGRRQDAFKVQKLPGGQVAVAIGGESQHYDENPPSFFDYVESLQSLVDWVVDYATAADTEDAVIFVGRKKIEGSINRARGYSSGDVELLLEPSPAIKALAVLAAGVQHRQFVSMLRGPLAGSYDDAYLPIFRRLDFKRLDETRRAVGNAGESLGRSVEAAAQSSAGDLPEKMAFNVPLFNLADWKTERVVYAVEVEASAETFTLYPEGNQLENAYQRAQMDLAEFLSTKTEGIARVYVGKTSE